MRIDVKSGGVDRDGKSNQFTHSVEVGAAKTDGLIFISSGGICRTRTYLTKEEAVIIANALLLEARMLQIVDV